jgi:hypothetical protein
MRLRISTLMMAFVFASGAIAQDYIRNVFGLGKKSAPKADSNEFKNASRAQIPTEYLLTPKNGPYHIKIASYVGDRGIEYALRLASELRNTHGMPAYVFNHKEKEPFYRPDAEKLAEMRKQFHGSAPRFPQLKTPIQDNWVVVVGDFQGIENDRAFDAAMKKLKRLNRESFSQPVAVELRWGTKANGKDPNELVGLHGTANPLRPRDQKLSDDELKTLKLIKSMNDAEPFSIYQLRKPYTLCVFKFTAAAGIVKNEKKSLMTKLMPGGEKKKIDMGTAADNAHIFCKTLRGMGYDAYVFHSDSASCVCVNGYEGRNDPKWVEDFRKFEKMDVYGIKLQPDFITTPQDPARVLNAN